MVQIYSNANVLVIFKFMELVKLLSLNIREDISFFLSEEGSSYRILYAFHAVLLS
jgi:hypothetical protein